MDPRAFDVLLRTVRAELTPDQCRALAQAAGEAADRRDVGQLIEAKTQAMDRERRCPRCNGNWVIKWGFNKLGRQRFFCRNCKRCFNPLTGTPLSGMCDAKNWLPFARELVDLRSVRNIEKRIGIYRSSAWRWRHRLLGALATRPPPTLSGIVEIDETFFGRSFKGSRAWQEGAAPLPRMPRYRGGGVGKRGVSPVLWAPVICAIDRNGALLEKVLPDDSGQSIRAELDGRIEPQSLICSDGAGAYPNIAGDYECDHVAIQLPKKNWLTTAIGAHPRVQGKLTLGRVDQRHQELKAAINHRFRGVSTRYLPNYLALLQVVRATGGDPTVFLRSAIGI